MEQLYMILLKDLQLHLLGSNWIIPCLCKKLRL
jgi:hypothetical protein